MEQTTQAPTGIIEPGEGAEGVLTAHRVKVLLAAAVLTAALGYLGFQAFQSATAYYLTVGELVERGATEEGRTVRVNGKLVEGSFDRSEGSTVATFSLTDGTQTITAQHDGTIPDLFFNEHSELTLEGSYGEDGVFQSHFVTVKCPSKYIAAE